MADDERAERRRPRSAAKLADLTMIVRVPGRPADVRTFTERIETARAERCRAFAEDALFTPRTARITGYDPMNMLRAGDRVLCARFIMLDGTLLRGPILLEMHPGTAYEVSGFFTKDDSATG